MKESVVNVEFGRSQKQVINLLFYAQSTIMVRSGQRPQKQSNNSVPKLVKVSESSKH